MLRIDEVAPDFTVETSQGTVSFHEGIGNGWPILNASELEALRSRDHQRQRFGRRSPEEISRWVESTPTLSADRSPTEGKGGWPKRSMILKGFMCRAGVPVRSSYSECNG